MKLTTPYVPGDFTPYLKFCSKKKLNLFFYFLKGYLAFREIEPCFNLYTKLLSESPAFRPQVFLFDGNGILHARGLGLASHFGVYTNTCTIGVAKNLYQMGNIQRDDSHLTKIKNLTQAGEHFLIENSNANGEILGAVRSLRIIDMAYAN